MASGRATQRRDLKGNFSAGWLHFQPVVDTRKSRREAVSRFVRRSLPVSGHQTIHARAAGRSRGPQNRSYVSVYGLSTRKSVHVDVFEPAVSRRVRLVREPPPSPFTFNLPLSPGFFSESKSEFFGNDSLCSAVWRCLPREERETTRVKETFAANISQKEGNVEMSFFSLSCLTSNQTE